jgi:hypothetical protein
MSEMDQKALPFDFYYVIMNVYQFSWQRSADNW